MLSDQRGCTVGGRRFDFTLGKLLEISVVALLTVVAGWIRIDGLDSLSPGIHIDESTYAAEIRRIANGEFIGKFSSASLGVPTLQFYVTAPLFKLFGPDGELWSIRIVSAAAGTLLVPTVFLFFRRFFGFTAAFATAALVSFNVFFALESRIGWPVMLAHLELFSGLALLILSVDRKVPLLSILAGVIVGAGMYTHQVFTPFWAACAGVPALLGLLHPRLRHRRELYMFAAAVFLTGANMAWFIFVEFDWVEDLENHYGASASIDIVRWSHRAWEVFLMFKNPISFDAVDAAPAVPILDALTRTFFLIGLAVSALRIRRAEYQLLAVGLLVGMSPTVLVPGSEARRMLVGMIFMFAIAGVGFSALYRIFAANLGEFVGTTNEKIIASARSFAYALALAGFAAAGMFNGGGLLQEWRDGGARWTFDYPLARLADKLTSFDESDTVHFYSDRRGVPHPVIDWFNPHLTVVDGESVAVEGERVLVVPQPRDGPIVVVLFESYLRHLPQLRREFLDAAVIEFSDEGRIDWQMLVIGES